MLSALLSAVPVRARAAPFTRHANRATTVDHLLDRCDAVRLRLHEYVYEELDLHDVNEQCVRECMSVHLDGCSRCARLEAQLQAIRQALSAVGARTHRIDYGGQAPHGCDSGRTSETVHDGAATRGTALPD